MQYQLITWDFARCTLVYSTDNVVMILGHDKREMQHLFSISAKNYLIDTR